MKISAKQRLDNFMNGLIRRNPGQSEHEAKVMYTPSKAANAGGSGGIRS